MKKYIGTIIILGILLVVLVIAGFAFRGWWLTDWPKLKKRLEKERKSKKGNAKKGKKKEKKKKTLDDYVEKIEVPKGKRIPLFTGEDKWEIEVYRKSNDNGEEIRLTTFKINLLNFIYGDEKGCKIRHISEADNKIIVTAGKKDGFIHGTLRFVQDYGLIFETRKHKNTKNPPPIYTDSLGGKKKIRFVSIENGTKLYFGDEFTLVFLKKPFMVDVKVQPEEVYIRSEENGEISLDTMAVVCYKFFKKCIKPLDKAAEAIRKVCFNNDADTEDESPEGTEEQTTGGKKES